jgi:xanthine/CO dehydrogenase XdhC/CoxF family maturation factor
MTHSAAAVISAGICAAVRPVGVSRTLTAEVTRVRDILSGITKWWEAGESFGLATVTHTYRSAPRDPGAALAVSAAGNHEVVGSVSGGCVEGAVYELSLDVCTGQALTDTEGRIHHQLALS